MFPDCWCGACPLWQCSRHQSCVRPAQAWTCTKLTAGVELRGAIVSWPPERRSFHLKVFPIWTWEIMIAVTSTPWLLATTPWRQEETGAVCTGLWTTTRCTDHWDTSLPRILLPSINITWRKWSQPRSGWIFPSDWVLILFHFRNNRAARHGLTLDWDIFSEQLKT